MKACLYSRGKDRAGGYEEIHVVLFEFVVTFEVTWTRASSYMIQRTWVFYLPCSFSFSRLFYDHDVVKLLSISVSDYIVPLSSNVAYKIISKLFAD